MQINQPVHSYFCKYSLCGFVWHIGTDLNNMLKYYSCSFHLILLQCGDIVIDVQHVEVHYGCPCVASRCPIHIRSLDSQNVRTLSL